MRAESVVGRQDDETQRKLSGRLRDLKGCVLQGWNDGGTCKSAVHRTVKLLNVVLRGALLPLFFWRKIHPLGYRLEDVVLNS